MNPEDLKINLVHVHVKAVEGIEGELRVVSVHRTLRVTVEYISVEEYRDGNWEPGLQYSATYADWSTLIRCLEDYIGAPVEEWHNYSSEPLDTSGMTASNQTASLSSFVEMVHARALPLPRGAAFRLTSIYWRQIEKYGTWDEDRALAEQEAELKS
jgi:hypothetical protein